MTLTLSGHIGDGLAEGTRRTSGVRCFIATLADTSHVSSCMRDIFTHLSSSSSGMSGGPFPWCSEVVHQCHHRLCLTARTISYEVPQSEFFL